MSGALGNSASRFRAAHEADWARLEALIGTIERRSVRALGDDDLLALPLLYRTALSSLAGARATSLDRGLVGYLEQLCTRAYFQLYGPPGSPWRQVAAFFAHGWPAAVRALWRETLAMALLTAGAAIAAFLLVRGDPSWFYGIMPDAMTDGRDPTATAASLRATLHGHGPDRNEGALVTFATALFTHNAQIAISAFALGLAFGVPTILLIVYNGLTLGAFLAVFVEKGLGIDCAQWLAIHGTTELFAITLAGAAGLHIGLSLAFPGRQTRLDAATAAGRRAAVVMMGAVVMLLVAGLLEGIGRQTIDSGPLRAAIGCAMLTGWLLYFYLPGRRDVA